MDLRLVKRFLPQRNTNKFSQLLGIYLLTVLEVGTHSFLWNFSISLEIISSSVRAVAVPSAKAKHLVECRRSCYSARSLRHASLSGKFWNSLRCFAHTLQSILSSLISMLFIESVKELTVKYIDYLLLNGQALQADRKMLCRQVIIINIFFF